MTFQIQPHDRITRAFGSDYFVEYANNCKTVEELAETIKRVITDVCKTCIETNDTRNLREVFGYDFDMLNAQKYIDRIDFNEIADSYKDDLQTSEPEDMAY